MSRRLLAPAAILLLATTASAQEGVDTKKLVGWYSFDTAFDKPQTCRKVTQADAQSFTSCTATREGAVFECKAAQDKIYWVLKSKKECNKTKNVLENEP